MTLLCSKIALARSVILLWRISVSEIGWKYEVFLIDESPLSVTQFFAKVEVGTVLKVKGIFQNGTLGAEEVEIEVE